MDFGRWFASQGPAPEPTPPKAELALPENVDERADGTLTCPCVTCGRTTEVEPEWLDGTTYPFINWCGKDDRCCP